MKAPHLLACAFAAVAIVPTTAARAETGYDLWLRHQAHHHHCECVLHTAPPLLRSMGEQAGGPYHRF